MSAAASDKTTNNAAVLEDLSKFMKSTEILELGISQYAFNKSKKGKVLIINNINFPAKMEQYLRKEYISNNFKKYFEEEDKIDQEYCKSKSFNADCFKKAFKWEYIEDCTKYKKNPVNELRALRLRPGGTTESEKTIKEMCAKFLPQSSPQYHQDLSAQGMTDVLKKFAGEMKTTETADAAFIFILSLGNKAGILGVDEKELSLIDIFKMFNPANCPGLANKPKVFIIQTCGRETSDTTPTQSTQINYSGASQTGKKERTSQIDDILVAFSTGWGYKSVQDPAAGTLFMQVLHDVIASKSSKGATIEQLLKKVQIVIRHYRHHQLATVKQSAGNNQAEDIAQSPGYYSHLSKDLILM